VSEPGTRAPGDEPVAGPAEPAAPGPEVDPTDGAASGVEEPSLTSASVDDAVDAPVAAAAAPRKSLRGRVVSFRFHLPRTRSGVFALLLVMGALGFAGIWTGVTLVHWTETADFCGRCHQMGPELAAYESGPHRDVTCGECHVGPGVEGWIKAKLNGTKQLIQVLTGLYPKPVPPPDHENLPDTKDTCLNCHSLDRLMTTTLVTRTSFAEDEINTRAFVGLMIRPGGGNTFDVNRSVHWHVLRDVEIRSADPSLDKIDYVSVTEADGTFEEFIAQDKVKVGEDVQPDLDAIKAAEPAHRMDCIQCHNRVGHPIPNPRQGLDSALYADRIDPALPYIKREGMRILTNSYPDQATAFAEADKLGDFYQLQYPAVARGKSAEIDQATTQIKLLYTLTATPDMKESYASYPDFMGHMDFPGCFRCHDGGHFLVKDGAVTKEVIPYTCDTCHTFPQIGSAVASLPLGQPPATHDDNLWVFDHRSVATSVDPGTQTCGECHARDYCENCHRTGAVNVNHNEMATNHAQAIREAGNTACAYCHQPVYCARCHAEQVLPVTGTPQSGAPTTAPQGILWPLIARGPAATGRAAP
jgi:nitrate/TMAO reductase-like tetraheme cytochrome c subunit